MQPVPRVSAEAVAAARLAEERRRTEDEVKAVVEVLRAARSRGEYPTRSSVEDSGVLAPDGAYMSRSRIRAAISRATSSSRVRIVPLPKELRAGQRREYLEPATQ